jgi:hypothetical protein
MTRVTKRTKGAGVFTMCEFDQLVMSMGAGTLGKCGCNRTILRAPAMRCDGTGRDGDGRGFDGDGRWFDGDGQWFNNDDGSAAVQTSYSSWKYGK